MDGRLGGILHPHRGRGRRLHHLHHPRHLVTPVGVLGVARVVPGDVGRDHGGVQGVVGERLEEGEGRARGKGEKRERGFRSKSIN